jgi:RHS repeat-associated protein
VRRGGATYRVISDQLGSPRYVVNVANSGDVPFGFAGGHCDEDTALVRFGARDYDPSSGRWVTKDPARWINLRATNFFAYASSDPINLSDPAGKDPTYSQCSQMTTTDYNACIHGCESIIDEVCSLFGDSTQADCERSCKKESGWQLDLCDSLLGPKNPAQHPKPDSLPLDGPCWGWSCYAGL